MKNLLLLIIIFFAYVNPLRSCTCDYSLEEDLKESKFIFIVEVIESFDQPTWLESKNYSKNEIDSILRISGYHVKARIQKKYKGESINDTIIIKGDRGFSCAQEFLLGETYLVFLDSRDSIFS